jgi:hypothetical protein
MGSAVKPHHARQADDRDDHRGAGQGSRPPSHRCGIGVPHPTPGWQASLRATTRSR